MVLIRFGVSIFAHFAYIHRLYSSLFNTKTFALPNSETQTKILSSIALNFNFKTLLTITPGFTVQLLALNQFPFCTGLRQNAQRQSKFETEKTLLLLLVASI